MAYSCLNGNLRPPSGYVVVSRQSIAAWRRDSRRQEFMLQIDTLHAQQRPLYALDALYVVFGAEATFDNISQQPIT